MLKLKTFITAYPKRFSLSAFFFFPRKGEKELFVAQKVKCLPAMRETQVRFLGWEDPLEKEMANHSSTLAWKIPWTEKLVGYSSWGCKESDTTERLHFHFSFLIGV